MAKTAVQFHHFRFSELQTSSCDLGICQHHKPTTSLDLVKVVGRARVNSIALKYLLQEEAQLQLTTNQKCRLFINKRSTKMKNVSDGHMCR